MKDLTSKNKFKDSGPESIFTKNSVFLSKSLLDRIKNLKRSPFEFISSKNGDPNLKLQELYLHSRHDPSKESDRMAKELPYDNTDRIYLFIGCGLGYTIQFALKNREKAQAVWLESNPFILKHALETFDYSELLESGRLQILLDPIQEEELYSTFRGRSTTPVTIVPHRGSLLLANDDYTKLRLLAEGFFQKKDVNLATLIRFEKIWTKNILKNLITTLGMQPVSKLFGITDGPILVVGAGPSLAHSIPDIQQFLDYYLIIAVDTAVPVLSAHGIDPDLIYTVDPQALNRLYLESYSGNAAIILDPTSTYLTPRISSFTRRGFFTLSPFPLTKILENISKSEIGNVPFGGSVSTNAFGLAELMGGNPIYLVGQDLAFSFGHAHAKGAVMEERLNYQESRRFRRELHNYKQLYYLPRYMEDAHSKSQETNTFRLVTNEKMIIFRNWFSSNATKATNLTHTGLKIPNLRNSNFQAEFSKLNPDLASEWKDKTRKSRECIRDLLNDSEDWSKKSSLVQVLDLLSEELKSYQNLVQKGLDLSRTIYEDISEKKDNPATMGERIRKMDEIDSQVSSHKNLSDILSSSMQRAIYSVTEGFETSLTPEEKMNSNLAIAKKSFLLYKALSNQSKDMIHQIHKVLMELRLDFADN